MEYLLILLVIFYLSPWVLAESIEHRRANAILFLNLGLGWTGIGWLAAAGWVYRDWPRPAKRPALVVVRPDAAPRPDAWRRALPPSLASLALVAAVATISSLDPAQGRSGWELAEVGHTTASVHLGAGSDWPAIGRLPARCRVRVLEREAGWLRIWRLDDCGDGMPGRAGWTRMEALRAVPGPAREGTALAGGHPPDG